MKALLIPADPSRSVELIEINGRDDLRQHVGGISEATQYDYDAIMYVSDTGRLDSQPMNLRATEYIRTESEAAKQGRMIGIDPSYGLYGNVVVAGNAAQGLGTCLIGWLNASGPPRDVSLGDRIRDVLRDRNEDGMINIPWPRDKNAPYVVEVTEPGQEPQYLSAAGMRDAGPHLDKLSEAATFERKGDAKYFAHITGQQPDVAGSNIAVVRESEAQAYERTRLDREATKNFREEVMAAHEAWQNDLQNTDLEHDYFDKMDRLDHNLAERGLERGEETEEIPLQSLEQSLEQSIDQSIDRGGRKR